MNRKIVSLYHKYCDLIGGPPPAKKTFYLHIPKCGGTSITQAIASCYTKFRLLPPFRRTDAINFLKPVESTKGAKISGLDLAQYRQYLLYYFLSMEQLQCICGHYTFSKKVYHEFADEWCFITMLRHPVSRWFSHYFFNRYKTHDHYKIDEEIESFVDSREGNHLGQSLIYNLTGHGYFESVPQEVIDEAIENLKQFSVVGCLEHLDLFVKQFEIVQKVKLNIETANINPLGRLKQKEYISKEIREKVEKICQPDMQVYNYALSNLLEH